MTLLTMLAAITITVSPVVCHDPCDVRVTIKMESHAANSEMVLELDSGAYYRLSNLPLRDTSPRTVEIWYKQLPSGDYKIKATLFRHDAKTWVAGEDVKTMKVVGFENTKGKRK